MIFLPTLKLNKTIDFIIMEKDKVIDWEVDGMTCSNCALSIQRYLEKQGMEDVDVSFATKSVQFTLVDEEVDIDQFRSGIKKLGFQVTGGTGIDLQGQTGWLTINRMLILSAIFTAPLFLYHFVMIAGGRWWVLDLPWVQLMLCLPVYAIGLWHFGRSAFFSLKSGVPNMDVLIFMGSTAAFIYSLIGLILNNPDYLFFETAATIITLVLMGNWIEERAVQQTTTAIEDLEKLKVHEANKVLADGKIERIPLSQIEVNDILQINEGDDIPTDGLLINGQLLINEAMITGESVPQRKEAGFALTGSTQVVSGNGQMRVSAVGKDTLLSNIISLVKKAQKDKPDIQRLADRISAVFVPLVLGIALLAIPIGYYVLGFNLSTSIMNAVAVLVISCPCAMGLATPTAVMVGVGRMARSGVLIKGGKTIEHMAAIRSLVFDKTGTLTTGAFKVFDINYHHSDKAWVNLLMLKMEQPSSHPIAKSIVQHFQTLELSDQDLKGFSVLEIKGEGMQAKTGEDLFELKRSPDQHQDQYLTLALFKNGEVLATIKLEDELKSDAATTIKAMKEQGYETIILSGDKHQRVQDVAQKVGADRFFAEKLPKEKLDIITQENEKTPVAMIGDGINDAPALAKASLGISLSNASQIAMNTAQVVILGDKLAHLDTGLKISHATLQTIRQNLFWAFSYNLVAIPIAVLGFLNPMFGALFMAFSDVVVIGNSIRLKYKRIK